MESAGIENGSHAAEFGSEDVVGATGSRGGHDFQADALAQDGRAQDLWGENLAHAGAEHDDLGLQCQHALQIVQGKRLHGRRHPVGDELVGGDDDG